MKLQYFRKGFAYNSSSSHGIVFIRPGDSDHLPYDDYGREKFLLVSAKEKAKYIAAQARTALENSLGGSSYYSGTKGKGNIANMLVARMFGEEVTTDLYVDHQSTLTFPSVLNGTMNDFIEDFGWHVINNDKIVIHGGSDEDEDNYSEHKNTELNSALHGYKRTVARKERDGTWILFDKENGTKIRFSPDFVRTLNRKADTPELVDIKITNRCSHGCKFCYQDSKTNGHHCSLGDYKKLIDKLSELHVFEVVLGGGEPTEHPEFALMLEYAKEKGIVPNFTTRSIDWLSQDESMCKIVGASIGSFAISCNNLTEVIEAQASMEGGYYDQLRNPYDSIAYQVIVGITPIDEIEKIAKWVDKNWPNSLSLVGYKTTGRANKEVPFVNGIELKKALEKSNISSVSVDTSLLKQCPELMQEYTCETEEGLHSMYVDLVDKKMSLSSYSGTPQTLDLNNLRKFFTKL